MALAGFKPKKKYTWHYSEIPEDPEVAELMPGFEIQYIITEDTVPENKNAIFGHCVFPPKSAHYKHKHTNAEEVVYVIKGQVVNGVTTEEGDIESVCGPGTASFVKKGQPHWTRNPFNEPAEFVFAYFGCSSLDKSGYVDLRPEKYRK